MKCCYWGNTQNEIPYVCVSWRNLKIDSIGLILSLNLIQSDFDGGSFNSLGRFCLWGNLFLLFLILSRVIWSSLRGLWDSSEILGGILDDYLSVWKNVDHSPGARAIRQRSSSSSSFFFPFSRLKCGILLLCFLVILLKGVIAGCQLIRPRRRTDEKHEVGEGEGEGGGLSLLDNWFIIHIITGRHFVYLLATLIMITIFN